MAPPRLSQAKVDALRSAFAAGMTVSAAAREVGVDRGAASRERARMRSETKDDLPPPRHHRAMTAEQLDATLDAITKVKAVHGRIHVGETAKLLGIAQATASLRIHRLALLGRLGTDPVMPGFIITQASNEVRADGSSGKAWVQQKPDRPKFEMPKGHLVKGVSALVDSSGGKIAEWIKTSKDDGTVDVVAAITGAFEAYAGRAELAPAPAYSDADLLTAYLIADHHLGMFAWARETGEAYDLVIAARLLRETMARLVAQTPASEVGVVLGLGDFYHADNFSNQTSRSHNTLDVDTRYPKVLQLGFELILDCVEMALQKHARVVVRMLRGNHDDHTALALTLALSAFFRGNPRVTVDTDPSVYWMMVWGRVMLVAHHGHLVKATDLPGKVAAKWAPEWGQTQYRYAYSGHIHHKSKTGDERDGLISETFQTLAAKDAYHAGMGYAAGRSMTAITHHKDSGEFARSSATVPAGFGGAG